MNKKEVLLIFLLCLEFYLFVFSWGQIIDLKTGSFQQKIKKFKELSKSYYYPQDIKIQSNSICPRGYSLLLPYLTCKEVYEGASPSNQDLDVPIDSHQREHCYESPTNADHLFMKHPTLPSDQWIELKICGKKIKSTLFRYYQIQFDTVGLFQVVCSYTDTKKLGYIQFNNSCTTFSYQQKCLPGQIRFESEFLITCLKDKDQQLQLSQFNCTQGEKACSSFQTLFCLKDTEECPITEIYDNKFGALDINLGGNDMTKIRITDVEISEEDYKLDYIYNIEVRNYGAKDTQNVQSKRQKVGLQNKRQIKLAIEDIQQTVQRNISEELIEGEEALYENKIVVNKVRQEFKETNPQRIDPDDCFRVTSDNASYYQVYYSLFLISELIGFILLLQLLKIIDSRQLKQFFQYKAYSGLVMLMLHQVSLFYRIVKISSYISLVFDLDQNLFQAMYYTSLSDYLLYIQYLISVLYHVYDKLKLYFR